jgi:hypothetical protein
MATWAQVGNIKGPTGSSGSTGPPGTPGAPGLGFTWRAAWSSSTAYAINDCVLASNNQTYVCIVAGTGFDPVTDSTHWSLMVGTPVADWNTMVNKPATFPPSPHAASHLPGSLGVVTSTDWSVPTGVVLDFAGPIVPSGFLLCDGSIIDRQTYAPLFGVIGTIFGQGDGSTTFNLPNPVDQMFNKIIKI